MLKDNSLNGRDGVLVMSSKSNSSTTESFIPIKAIVNNMIELDSGFKVAGVKIYPKNNLEFNTDYKKLWFDK